MILIPFLPELILSACIFFILCASLKKTPLSIKGLLSAGMAGAAASFAASLFTFPMSDLLFHGTYRIDSFSQSYKALISLGLMYVLYLMRSSVAIIQAKMLETTLFLFAATLGMTMMPSCVNLLTLYVAMELSSYSLYLLAALRQGHRNAEASTKYLIFGAAASGVFLWGASFLIGLTGGASYSALSGFSAQSGSQGVYLVAMGFVLFAFLFKLSGFPVHFWAPDVYEASATPVTTFIATASKAAAIAMISRLFMAGPLSPHFILVLGIVAFLSMTIGNTAALLQKDVKRLLAYSSVAQAGYLLVGLLAASPEGYSTALFYVLAYLLMNSAAFFVVWLVSDSIKHDNPQLVHFNGLAEKSPKAAMLLLLSLLSLAGIPPLAGFTGKWILFSAAMDKGHWFLVLWAVLNSVVSLFYYLSIVKHAYIEKPSDPEPITLTPARFLLVLFFMAAIAGLGVFPNAFIETARQAISSVAVPQ